MKNLEFISYFLVGGGLISLVWLLIALKVRWERRRLWKDRR